MSASLEKKLNIKEGMKVQVIGKPADVDLGDVKVGSPPTTEGVIVFVKRLAEVDATCAPAIEAAKKDRIAWILYPKAGKLGTDLNRDILWKHLLTKGIQGVRQIAIDDVWSAMRFRPKK